ncbi:MAG: hypothetical protein V1790_13510 [Planctomycetota bacterium]
MTPVGDLSDVVIAFDIDNTLLDPDGADYRRTVGKFLGVHDLGLNAAEAYDAFEAIRTRGGVLERIGLANPRHERGCADGLAVLCLMHCTNPDLLVEPGIHPADQTTHRDTFTELSELDRATREGDFDDRLDAACRVRKFCATDPRIARLRDEVLRISRHPAVRAWARTYEAIENEEPVNDVRPLLEGLVSRGATPIVITEGREEVQMRKIRRLGVGDMLRGCVLITETAAELPGVRELESAIAALIDKKTHSGCSSAQNAELHLLWYFHSVVDEWATKSASFYARCLHAVHQNPNDPQSALARLAVVPADEWAQQPLRFVMVGDRYDKDVLPLIELLGCDVGMTVRLRAGKYAALHPEDELPPHRRPSRTFTSWDALSTFLTDDLTVEDIRPITAPPPIVPPTELRWDYIERGLESAIESVRLVAELVSATVR